MNSQLTLANRIQSVYLLSGRALRRDFLTMRQGIIERKKNLWWGVVITVILLALVFNATWASADEAPSGDTIIGQMNARDEGESVCREMLIELTDRRGHTRFEEAVAFRRRFGSTQKTVVFYTKPVNVQGTGFLAWDYADAREDDQWLFLPALRKIRRISASDRAAFFSGTDFSYEEIRKESKISAEDYQFQQIGEEKINGRQTWVVEAMPASSEVAAILGYSRVVLHVDPEMWMPLQSEYWDVAGDYLKTIYVKVITNIEGIWTVEEIEVKNHKTGHQTRIFFHNIDYQAVVPDWLFEQNALKWEAARDGEGAAAKVTSPNGYHVTGSASPCKFKNSL